eukprot:scaffold34288_cov129-Isochrysis_galbana.AAC.1
MVRRGGLFGAVKTIRFVEAFAEALGESPQSMWPMSRGVAALLISGEQQRATGVGRLRLKGRSRRGFLSFTSFFDWLID